MMLDASAFETSCRKRQKQTNGGKTYPATDVGMGINNKKLC